MPNFSSIREVRAWAKELDLEVKEDEGLTPTEHVIWLQTFEDRSVGIFPIQLSPGFGTESELVTFVHDNQDRIVEFCELDYWDTPEADAMIGFLRDQIPD